MAPPNLPITGGEALNKMAISKSTPRIKLLIEMERLGLIGSAGLNDLRHKILSYRAGDFCLPIGGIERERERERGYGNPTSHHNLAHWLDCLWQKLFHQSHEWVLRVRHAGVDQNHMEEGLEEVSTWMTDGVRHHQPCKRAGDENIKGLIQLSESMEFTNSRYINRKVNLVMVVTDLSEIHRAFKSGDLEPIVALRTLFHFPPIKNSSKS
ncbi:hypothetical protein SASPL_112576 [Salvia splendens]|uniref:Uncharacterized protein n=1 Tax=Salvia splendens TaxID=180675 RepID=A0A8X8Y8F4_SALSN|nr:hypothetical protein SASPL_112576 [Salvia splendens]